MALSSFALLFLFGEELDENLMVWMLHFLFDKGLALIAIMIVARLYKLWSKTDSWFIAYEEWCKKGEDAPNLICLKNNEG